MQPAGLVSDLLSSASWFITHLWHGHAPSVTQLHTSLPGTKCWHLCLFNSCCSASGTVTRAEIEDTYAISRRIEGEERSLDAALLVFTSTQQEVKDQWGLYDG